MKKIYSLLLAIVVLTTAQAADITKSGEITSSEKWTKDNVYMLDGFVFVKSGATLTIEAGTVVKGLSKSSITSGDFTSALIITRGGKIDAQGTASEPIIFTSELDDVSATDDLNLSDETESRGLWGGVILLGKAPIGDESTEATIEGLPEGENATYGGSAENDNSGTMKYCSIRHGGAEIVTDEEINGLSLGGVGSGTTLEHIEVAYNKDDGIEFFGGSVSIKWAIVSYCGDDSYDWDLGWRGNGQFWVAIGDTEAGDHGGEWDGAKPDDNPRYANPNIYNFTFIGGYDGSKGAAKNEHAIILRDGSAGTIANGIIAGYNNYALQIEETGKSKHSFGYMKDGDLKLMNNIWHDFGSGSSWDDIILPTPETGSATHLEDVKSHLSANNNELAASGIDITKRPVNLVPNGASLADTKEHATPEGDWFSSADYIGAFQPGGANWASWAVAFDYNLAAYVGINNNTNVIGAAVYPNPATSNTTLNFTLETKDQVSLQVLDITGKNVLDLGTKSYNSGVNQVNITTSELTSGVYFINLQSEKSFFTERLIIE